MGIQARVGSLLATVAAGRVGVKARPACAPAEATSLPPAQGARASGREHRRGFTAASYGSTAVGIRRWPIGPCGAKGCQPSRSL